MLNPMCHSSTWVNIDVTQLPVGAVGDALDERGPPVDEVPAWPRDQQRASAAADPLPPPVASDQHEDHDVDPDERRA